LDSADRRKAECRGILYLEGITAGVFLEARVQAFQKSPQLHLQPQAKYPKFHPKPQNLANSNDLGELYRNTQNVIVLVYLLM